MFTPPIAITITGNANLNCSNRFVLADTTNNNITIGLPNLITNQWNSRTLNQGFTFTIKKIAAANTVTIFSTIGETIDNQATATLTSLDDYLIIEYDGYNWFKVSSKETGGGGTVVAVNGTASRITSSGGISPTINIDAGYLGQTSLTTLGTIGTGVWQGTSISTTYTDAKLTSFSSNNLSPLFTTSVVSSTSAPILSFAQISQSQNLFYASPSGSAGVPLFRAIYTNDLPAGTGTVTSVATSTGLTGGTITSIGTISLDSKLAPMDSIVGNSLKLLRVNVGETAVEYFSAPSGTVKSISSGNLSPLFTSSVISSDVSPSIAYAQISQLPNTVLASPDGSGGNPTFRQILNGDITNSTINLTTKVTGILPSANGGNDALVDYSATSTIVGWSSFTTKYITYSQGLNYIKVWFSLIGTSNSTSTSFTIPVNASAGIPTGGNYIGITFSARNNSGTPVVGSYTLTASSNIITFNSVVSGGAWTASGTKHIIGELTVPF